MLEYLHTEQYVKYNKMGFYRFTKKNIKDENHIVIIFWTENMRWNHVFKIWVKEKKKEKKKEEKSWVCFRKKNKNWDRKGISGIQP